MIARGLLCATLVAPLRALSARAGGRNGRSTLGANSTSNSPFMLVSGVTSPKELCLAAEGAMASIGLQDCVAAVAAGDGREIWKFQPDGQLVNVGREKCAVVAGDGAAPGRAVVLAECGGAAQSKWEVLGSGQLKVASHPVDLCLSQEGLAPALANVALRAAVSSSSTMSTSHGPAMAVDSNEASYWASKFDIADSPVSFTVDLGESHTLQELEIDWVFPAKAFSVGLSSDGRQFAEAFSTDVNVLKQTRVPLGATARVVKITMSEPHAIHGTFHGHSLYGIKEIALRGVGLAAIVEECEVAAKAKDARDKVFVSSVSQYDPSFGQNLRSELPSLEAAKTSLAATTSELAGALLQMASCPGAHAALMAQEGAGPLAAVALPAVLSTVAESGRPMLDTSTVKALLAEARSTILGARKALA